MTRIAFGLIAVTTLLLTGCDATAPSNVPRGTVGMSAENAAQSACKASTSIESLIVVSRIDVTEVRPTATGFEVDLLVDAERDPYTCVTDSLGNVQSVTFTGQGRPQAD